MHLVAKVFDLDITEEEVLGESENLIGKDSRLAMVQTLNRLIDRCLLLHEAIKLGFDATDDEFDSALLETLEDMDTPPQDEEQTRSMEERIRRRIIIRKYVQRICAQDAMIGEDKLLAFYEDQKDIFNAPESIRASHILTRADVPEAEKVARELRSTIKTADDFRAVCSEHSQCPTGVRCGDLGWFPRGRLIKEIEEAAFALEPGQISDVFKTLHGWHILMVTERKTREPVPFFEIKDSLKAKLEQLEREYFLIRHVNDLRELNRSQITILDDNYTI